MGRWNFLAAAGERRTAIAVALAVGLVGVAVGWAQVLGPRYGSAQVQQIHALDSPDGPRLVSIERRGSNLAHGLGAIYRLSLVDPALGARLGRTILPGRVRFLGQAGPLWILYDDGHLEAREPLTLAEVPISAQVRAAHPALIEKVGAARIDAAARALMITDDRGITTSLDAHALGLPPSAHFAEPGRDFSSAEFHLTSGHPRETMVARDGGESTETFIAPALLADVPDGVLLSSRDRLSNDFLLSVSRVDATGHARWWAALEGQERVLRAFVLGNSVAVVSSGRDGDGDLLTTFALDDGRVLARYAY